MAIFHVGHQLGSVGAALMHAAIDQAPGFIDANTGEEMEQLLSLEETKEDLKKKVLTGEIKPCGMGAQKAPSKPRASYPEHACTPPRRGILCSRACIFFCPTAPPLPMQSTSTTCSPRRSKGAAFRHGGHVRNGAQEGAEATSSQQGW